MGSNEEIEQTITALTKLSVLSNSIWNITIFDGVEPVAQYEANGIYSAFEYAFEIIVSDAPFELVRVGSRGIVYENKESETIILLEPKQEDPIRITKREFRRK